MTHNSQQLENYSNLIWSVADMLRGTFQDDDYGTIILPFALLRRIECALEPSRQQVVDRYEQCRALGMILESQYGDMLKRETKAPFFNTTQFRLNRIGASNTRSDMDAYLDGFSKNLRDIFDKMNFKNICDQLQDADLLYATIQHFQNLDLSPKSVPTRVMSNIYEELIWRFASTKHKQSKEFLTPRDVVRLATTLVMSADGDLLTSDNGQIRSIYDPTCSSCGFINDAIELIDEYAEKSGAKYPPMLIPAGQEISPVSWAIGKAMMLLQSMTDDETIDTVPVDKSEGISLGNTLTDDQHSGEQFSYVLSNPPFGLDWSKEAPVVAKDPRFAPIGLPQRSDGSMLFLTHVAKKIADKGHGAIVLSGSPLFTGDAGSGSSNIRRWLFENDLVEAIIQMPPSLFYNTSISTYLWLLSKDKPAEKKGKIQLINASELKTLIKNIGSKRYIISDDDIASIARLVADFKDTDISKICDYRDFGYRAVVIQCPRRAKYIINEDNIQKVMSLELIKNKLKPDAQKVLQEHLTLHIGEAKANFFDYFTDELKALKVKLTKPLIQAIDEVLSVEDPNGDICKDSKGNIVFNPDSKFVERIPLLEDVVAYITSEVKPFVPDAMVDTSALDPQDGQPGIVGYEVNFNKYFFKYELPEDPDVIYSEVCSLTKELQKAIEEFHLNFGEGNAN